MSKNSLGFMFQFDPFTCIIGIEHPITELYNISQNASNAEETLRLFSEYNFGFKSYFAQAFTVNCPYLDLNLNNLKEYLFYKRKKVPLGTQWRYSCLESILEEIACNFTADDIRDRLDGFYNYSIELDMYTSTLNFMAVVKSNYSREQLKFLDKKLCKIKVKDIYSSIHDYAQHKLNCRTLK
jgi:hypothetical protein